MQNHPGLWYLPWGVPGVPVQKLQAVQFQHLGTAPQPGPYASAATDPNGNPFTCQVLPNQHQHSPNSAAVLQVQTAPHNYQHPTLHPAPGAHVASMGVYSCHNTGTGAMHRTAAAAHSPGLNAHGHTHLQASQLQSSQAQALHPVSAAAAAAAAMFTPLSLRSFLASATNPLAALSAQQSMASCGPSVVHQPSAAMAAAQQLSCISTPAPSQHHQHQQQQQHHQQQHQQHQQLSTSALNLNVGVVAMRQHAAANGLSVNAILPLPTKKLISPCDKEKLKVQNPEKRKAEEPEQIKDLKKAKLETKALKAKRPGFTDDRYHETSYYIENGLRKVYPYYFTFTTFTKGRWVGEKILDVFAREFRAHPAEEYERCINVGTLTVNYEKVPTDYKLKHNDLLANIVHRHEVPVTSQPITIVHMDDDIVVVNKPASIPVHPCGRYRHNTVVFILAKEYNLKNLRTIHRLDRLTSGLLLFGRSPKKARQMEHQIRNRQVQKEYICRVEGDFPDGIIECKEPIEVVSYKIGVCKVSPKGKDCTTTFQKIAHNGETSVVLCKPLTGRMHQIRVHLQFLGYPVVNDPLYNHEVFGPVKGRGGDVGGKTDEELIRDLINIHNAENWLGIDGDSEISLFKTIKSDCDTENLNLCIEPCDDDSETVSREASPCSESPQPTRGKDGLNDNTSNTFAEHTTTAPVTELNAKASIEAKVVVRDGDGFTCNNGKANPHVKVTVATQTGHESPDMAFNTEKMTSDKHCYECKVRYRDPKPKDLVMFLHAWKYKGPGWEYETELPNWASVEWIEPEPE